ncbi:hypothetical protein BC332_03375 [Capsicum chinense]|nr:hypothetical protein BC332_03375 [Capsicum chinense]
MRQYFECTGMLSENGTEFYSETGTETETVGEPAPLPPPLTASTSPVIPVSDNNSKKTWVYIVVGVVGGFVDLSLLGFEAIEKPSNKKVEEELELLKSFIQHSSICKVYKFEEVKAATENFSPTCLIKGFVYRGTINGDFAAIKKMSGGSCSGPNKLLSPVTNDDVDEVSASFSDVMLNHLRTVKFTGTTGIKPEMELIKLPLDKSPMLVRMIVEPDQGDGSCEIRLKRLAELTKFWRQSPEAEVLYII